MTEFFKALEEFKKPTYPDTYYMLVEGQDIAKLGIGKHDNGVVIDKTTYKMLTDKGVDGFIYTENTVKSRPRGTSQVKHPELTSADKGYKLVDKDPAWPDTQGNAGQTWKTKL